MKKRLLFAVFLIVYFAILIKIMVFKEIPMISVGAMRFRFGGTQVGSANLVPFKTILAYVRGERGWLSAFINLIGNIVVMMPIGFIVPIIYPGLNWKKSLVIAFLAGFIIEGLQQILQVGIFDIDDVILNALGVMIGYWAFTISVKRMRPFKVLSVSSL